MKPSMNPTKNPYPKTSTDHKTWKKGYNHGLIHSANQKHINCPVTSQNMSQFKKVWDQGFVAGRQDQKHIPQGPYCYTPEKGQDLNSIVKSGYKIKACPFWGKRNPKDKEKSTIGAFGFCRITRSTDDLALSDQCKGCGVNDEYPDQSSIGGE